MEQKIGELAVGGSGSPQRPGYADVPSLADSRIALPKPPGMSHAILHRAAWSLVDKNPIEAAKLSLKRHGCDREGLVQIIGIRLADRRALGRRHAGASQDRRKFRALQEMHLGGEYPGKRLGESRRGTPGKKQCGEHRATKKISGLRLINALPEQRR